MVGPPLTVAVLVPPAVPLMVTPAPVKPLTGSLKTAVKLIGELLVGSAWPAAWLIVTEGGVVSAGVKLTLLSVLVEALLALPAASRATEVGILASTVRGLLMPLNATLSVLGPLLIVTVLLPPAVLLTFTPPLRSPLTGSLKTAVKLIGELFVGSAWPAAWLIVTAGRVASKLTLLSVLVEAVFRLPAASCATPAGMLASTVPSVVMPLTATV